VPSKIQYVAPPSATADEAAHMGLARGCGRVFPLLRRGVHHGWLGEQARAEMGSTAECKAAWRAAEAVLLPGLVASEIPPHSANLAASAQLMEQVLDGEACEELFDQLAYVARYGRRFELLSGVYDEGEPQAIATVEFDVLEDGEPIDEVVWVKASWLSFEDDDASLRFRFSHGHDLFDDVAVDFSRQKTAGELCDALFPESQILTGSPALRQRLSEILSVPELAFVERIVYFNAPNGGAQFHHDVERGHLGVVFAQLTGRTGWLALPKMQLVDEIERFVARPDSTDLLKAVLPAAAHRKKLLAKIADRPTLIAWMDEANNGPLEALLNRVPAFTQQLVERGNAFVVEPGDVLLLSQHEIDACAWHSVFCLDDYPGEALSFAVRAVASQGVA